MTLPGVLSISYLVSCNLYLLFFLFFFSTHKHSCWTLSLLWDHRFTAASHICITYYFLFCTYFINPSLFVTFIHEMNLSYFQVSLFSWNILFLRTFLHLFRKYFSFFQSSLSSSTFIRSSSSIASIANICAYKMSSIRTLILLLFFAIHCVCATNSTSYTIVVYFLTLMHSSHS